MKRPSMNQAEMTKRLGALPSQELVKLLLQSCKLSGEVKELVIRRLQSNHAGAPADNDKEKPGFKGKEAGGKPASGKAASGKPAGGKKGAAISMTAMKEWLKIDEPMRERLIRNVWCGQCADVTQIKDYTVSKDKLGIVLEGSCAACGAPVARVIES